MQWYYAVNGQQNGPVEEDVLSALARDGKLKPDDLVWNTTLGNQWAKASTVPGLFAGQTVDNTPPPEGPPLLSTWSSSTSCRSQTPNRDLMSEAQHSLGGNWGLAVGTGLIVIAIQIVLGVVPFVGALISFVISGALTLGWMMFFMGVARRESLSLGLMFQGFNRFGTAFLASLLMALLIFAWMLPGIVVMIIAVVAGARTAFHGAAPSPALLILLVPLALLIIIPVVLAQLRYSMTYFVMADDPDVDALDAIRRSTQMMRGNKWKFFCLQCRFIGWSLLCLLTLGIGFLWLTPYFWTSVARFYEDLRAGQQAG